MRANVFIRWVCHLDISHFPRMRHVVLQSLKKGPRAVQKEFRMTVGKPFHARSRFPCALVCPASNNRCVNVHQHKMQYNNDLSDRPRRSTERELTTSSAGKATEA